MDSRFVCERPLLIMKLSFNIILETYKGLEVGKGEQGASPDYTFPSHSPKIDLSWGLCQLSSTL